MCDKSLTCVHVVKHTYFFGMPLVVVVCIVVFSLVHIEHVKGRNVCKKKHQDIENRMDTILSNI